MSMRDKIKEAFNKGHSSKQFNKWDPDTQPNLYELYNFLRKSGYRLIDVVKSSKETPEILIEPIKPGYLHPDITHDISDDEFYIHVDEHGLLGTSDLAEIIKGYEAAIEIVDHLNSLDLNKLEIDIDED